MTRAELAAELAELALGTAEQDEQLLLRLGAAGTKLDVNEVEDLLLDLNVERCPGCGWWTNSHELILDEDEETALGCYDCLPDPNGAF